MRYLLAIALLFAFMGTVSADVVPVVTAPQTLPTVWTMSVYNGSGSDIQSGLAVRWDIDTSTNDLSMWVAINAAVADTRIAGVVPYGTPLLNGTVGEIIVKGPAIMYAAGNTTGAATQVEADANGRPVDETLSAQDEALLGWAIVANAGTAANTNLNDQYAVIFVDPTLVSE